MKLIFIRERGVSRHIAISRRMLAVIGALGLVALGAAGMYVTRDTVDAQVVAQWRVKLNEQKNKVVDLAQRNDAQNAAVGKQLAEMQARLLRMEAIGSYMAEVADLEAEEFDFNSVPAQGGPVLEGEFVADGDMIARELERLSEQLKRRETELDILHEVLVGADIYEASKVRGRPVRWGWMSSPYGRRVDPLTGGTGWHSGVDFAGRHGSDVIAVASGVVTFAGERQGYGKMVEISHAQGLVTRYAHHEEVTVRTGDVVEKGDRVGIMGSSGRSTGPHVHFEVLKNGRTVDPAGYISRRS